MLLAPGRHVRPPLAAATDAAMPPASRLSFSGSRASLTAPGVALRRSSTAMLVPWVAGRCWRHAWRAPTAAATTLSRSASSSSSSSPGAAASNPLLEALQALGLKLFGDDSNEDDGERKPQLPSKHKVMVPLPAEELARRALWAPAAPHQPGAGQAPPPAADSAAEVHFGCTLYASAALSSGRGRVPAVLVSVTPSTWEQLQDSRPAAPASAPLPAGVAPPVRLVVPPPPGPVTALRRRAGRQQLQRRQQQQQPEGPLVLAAGQVLSPLAGVLRPGVSRLVISGEWRRDASGGVGDYVLVTSCRVLADVPPEADEHRAWRQASEAVAARVSEGGVSADIEDVVPLAPMHLSALKLQFHSLKLDDSQGARASSSGGEQPVGAALALAISVTELCSAMWCGLQLAYQTAIGRRKRRTAIMAMGSAVHEVLELAVVHKVEVQAEVPEDLLAISLINAVACIRQLVTEGLTRELRVFAQLQDQWVVGVVDGLQYDRATHTVSLMETKTRSRKSMPPADQVDSARLQVHVYRELYDRFRQLSLPQVYEYLLVTSASGRGLDPDRPLSQHVAAVVLNPQQPGDAQPPPQQEQQQGAATAAGADRAAGSPQPSVTGEGGGGGWANLPVELLAASACAGAPPDPVPGGALARPAQEGPGPTDMLISPRPAAAAPADAPAQQPEPAGALQQQQADAHVDVWLPASSGGAQAAAAVSQEHASLGGTQGSKLGATPAAQDGLASAAAGEEGEEGAALLRPASPAGLSEGSSSSEELDTEALLRAWPTQNDGGDSPGQAARAASESAAAAGPVVTLRDCIRLLHESLAYLPPAGELHHLEYLWQQDHSVVIGQEQVPFDAAWLRPRLEHALSLWGGRAAPQPVPDAQTWKCRSCDFKDVCRRHNPGHPLSDPRAMAAAALDDRRRQREARRQMQQQQGQPPPAQQLQP